MLTRAKCKLCNKVIDIVSKDDWISCDCGEIMVKLVNSVMTVMSKHEGNLFSVDDQGNEILVQTIDPPISNVIEKPNRDDLIKMLDKMIKDIEDLPSQAMTTYISQYDLMSALMLVSELFKSKD